MSQSINYLGSKGSSGMAQFIIGKMPRHDVYIEPFLGTGKIMKAKERAKLNIGMDLNVSMLVQVKKELDNDFTIVRGDTLIFLDFLIRYSIDAHGYDASIVIYLDPPYPMSTRDDKYKQYEHELSDAQHQALLNQLLKIDQEYNNVYLMVSTYNNKLYSSMMHTWHHFTTNCMTRGGVREESLYTNFDPSQYIKHDYNFIGEDFTDRQRIKRKVKRWSNNFDKLPQDEKVLIYREIETSMRYQDLK